MYVQCMNEEVTGFLRKEKGLRKGSKEEVTLAFRIRLEIKSIQSMQ